jgi:hypothetical protein
VNDNDKNKENDLENNKKIEMKDFTDQPSNKFDILKENIKSENSESLDLDHLDSKIINNSKNDLIDKLNKKKTVKITRQFNIRQFLKNIFTCNFRKILYARKIQFKAEKNFDNYMFIKTYIDKMREIECLKKYLFNSEEERIFTYGLKPIFRKKKNSIKQEEFSSTEMNEKYEIYSRKDEKNQKLIDVVKEYYELTKS